MTQLKNCSSCGEVFAAVSRDICPHGYTAEEQKFQYVYQFLMKRKNRQANLEEIVAGTSVDEKRVVQFLKDNRLRIAEFPNLAYACENCGTSITSGKFCQACRMTMRNHWQSPTNQPANEQGSTTHAFHVLEAKKNKLSDD